MQEKEEQPSQVISKYQRRNHAAIIFWNKSWRIFITKPLLQIFMSSLRR
jgi:hypothetical protein